MIILGMLPESGSKSVGIVWTTYHYYVGEIAYLISSPKVNVTVYLFHDSDERPVSRDGVEFKSVSNLPYSLLQKQLENANHDTVVICGWHIESFRKLAKELNTRIILFIDNPWRSTYRQILGSIFFRAFWLKRYDGVVVPGFPQKKFARFLGFKEKEIQTGFFSFLNIRQRKYLSLVPVREFIFIGRLIDWKGIRELMMAHDRYRSLVANPWPLIICGDGILRSELENRVHVNFRGFLSRDQLFSELNKRRVFISCGIGEHWGISIYEAAFFGHPLILSNDAGATSAYLNDGINGVSIKGRDTEDILKALLLFHDFSDNQLINYSHESEKLASKHDNNYFESKVKKFILGEK